MATSNAELNEVVSAIEKAGVVISDALRTVHLIVSDHSTDTVNASGDEAKYMDHVADDAFQNALKACKQVCKFASEEVENETETGNPGKYYVVYDPLDGSQNLHVNLNTGSIFGIFDKANPKDGNDLVAAGYILFSSALQMVLAVKGEGVKQYTYDPSKQEFRTFSNDKITVPAKGKVYGINEGNQAAWTSQAVISFTEQMRGRSVRWMACMASDAHRILLDGGCFCYPCDKKNTKGRLRLLYECYPMAMVFEEADGMAIDPDFGGRILDVPFPSAELHRKVPVFLSGQFEGNLLTKLME